MHFALVEDLLGDRLSDSRVVVFILAALVTCVRRCAVKVKRISDVEDLVLIAYGEQCRIRDLRRRFSFGSRDQAWSLKSFCVAEFYKVLKGTEKVSDIDIMRGMKSAPLACLHQSLKCFYQTHSLNIPFKLTRLELTIERSYHTHSHNLHLLFYCVIISSGPKENNVLCD